MVIPKARGGSGLDKNWNDVGIELRQASKGNMRPRICKSCGELMAEKGGVLSRNPNICPSCLSMADGMGKANVFKLGDAVPEPRTTTQSEAGTAKLAKARSH
jgi:hypothetical protein